MTAQSATVLQQTRGTVPVKQSSASLLDQFDEIYDSISRRAFELFQSNGQLFGHEWDDWLRAESEILHPVHLDVTESDGEFTVVAEVPGFTAKELDIRVEPRRLTISGKRELKENNHGKKILSAICSNQILRSIDWPVDVDPSRVSASVKDGILSISLPKAAHARAVRVEPKPA
jgi:HSP20 family protein